MSNYKHNVTTRRKQHKIDLNTERRLLRITSSLLTAPSGKHAGRNNRRKIECNNSHEHLLPVHSEKGTQPPPHSTSCRSASTWEKGFQTEDAPLSGELSQGLLLTGPLSKSPSATQKCARLCTAAHGALERRYRVKGRESL